MPIPPRLGPILAQFDFARDRPVARVRGLTDDECFWEPVLNCWNVRRHEHARTPTPLGRGAWIQETERG
ncbi:MAG TPA: hypothetical protein VMU89_07260 [Thermomicrobiaceae bacterium]|nr:hypothetical protein [Thermomicrobiaceae bacterium]